MTPRLPRVLGRSTGLMGALCLLATACEPAAPPAMPPPAPPPLPPAATATATPAPAPAVAAASEPAKVTVPAPIVVKDAALKTPESVLYDTEADVYLVSNINGNPTQADDNGSIIKIDADGKVLDAAFIDGAKKDVTLNAPKGMAIVGNSLYVADLNVVRVFDRKTGKAIGEIKVPKATFLNDVTPGPANTLFVSDSGLKLGDKGLEPTGTDALYSVNTKTANARPMRANKDLLNPNGVLGDDDGVHVVTYGGSELYRLSKQGDREQITKLPKGGLDGIIKLPDGTFLVSSWQAGAVFRGRPGGTFEPILTGLMSPADIGYDGKRNRVLIPSFQTNSVIIQPLPELPALLEPVPAVAPAAAKPLDTPATAAPSTTKK